MKIIKWNFAVLFLLGINSAHALNVDHLNQELKKFKADPKVFMNSPDRTTKYDPETLKPIEVKPVFSPTEIESKDYIRHKDRIQKSSKANRLMERAIFQPNDRAEDLTDQMKFQTLSQIESAGLTRSSLSTQPWSGDYWPIFLGGLARRYLDPKFPNSEDWSVNMGYLSQNACSVNQSSPAQKYDLLVGDSSFSLTRAMMQEGQSYYSESGHVETWMGICHGWSPAAFMELRPVHTVTLLAADGRTKIDFYPSDIKALLSLTWAKAPPTYRTIGGRCDVKSPPEDANGRIQTPECFDTNPGTWHLAVVNQIGVSQRSFVMDATYDAEVWNQPVYRYEYQYFNPQLSQMVSSLDQAIVRREDFTQDKFSGYRAPNAAYFVGIAMQLVYIAETDANGEKTDSPQFDQKVAVNYFYDLELDQNYNVIGGEWYQRAHPDFLWVPAAGSSPQSVGDQELDRPEYSGMRWDGRGPMPAAWTRAAIAASREGQPLTRVVKTLNLLAQ